MINNITEVNHICGLSQNLTYVNPDPYTSVRTIGLTLENFIRLSYLSFEVAYN